MRSKRKFKALKRNGKKWYLRLLSEHDECSLFYARCRLHPVLCHIVHIPNEGRRHAAEQAKLNRIGFRKGIPDYVLPVKNLRYGSLWIEMKRQAEGVTSPEQLAWVEALMALGNYACVTEGCEEAWEVCIAYLENRL